MTEADKKIVRDALQGILDDDGRETSLDDQRKNWESRMRAARRALAVLDAKPTVPMAMLRLISIDPMHHGIRKTDAGLKLIAESFGYEVSE